MDDRLPRAGWGEGWRVSANEYNVSFQDEDILKLDFRGKPIELYTLRGEMCGMWIISQQIY